jgi:oligopeptide transport system substrate-binding protein
VLERNANYYAPASIPFLVYMFSTAVDPLSLYEEGTLDLLPVDTSTQKQLADPGATLHADLRTAPAMCTRMLRLNTNLAPLDDPGVRKALALATDKATLVELLTENTALPAGSILPPAMPGYLLGRAGLPFDPAAARAALDSSKYGSALPPITLLAPGLADSKRQDVDALVDMWQKTLGITVQVQYLPAQGFEQAVRKKPGHVVLTSWCADYPDPENFLDILYHTGGDFNLGQTALPALDALLEQARGELDSARRLALYQQAESLLLDSVDTIPLYYPVQGILVSPRLQGFFPSPIGVRLIPDLTLH